MLPLRPGKYTAMKEIYHILIQYQGSGAMLLLYAVALAVLLYNEKDRSVRLLFGYMPLVIFIVFFIPPVYRIYSRLDGADTYYRLLWLIPMSVTIVYSIARCFAGRRLIFLAGACMVIILCGQFTYSNVHIVKAENRLHIPQAVISVCDTITNDTGGERAMAAMPSELVTFVRQYDTRILMPYGREMLMPAYVNYYNSVYAAMEQTQVIDLHRLVEAAREYSCGYIVLNASRSISGNYEREGLELVTDLGAYRVYRDSGR